MKKIFVHCSLADSQESMLKNHFVIKKHNANESILSTNELLKLFDDCEGIICQGNFIDKRFLKEKKNTLKAISNVAVGYDNINVEEATKYKIAVFNTPNLLNDAVADLALGLTISIARKICLGNEYVKKGNWKKNSWPLFWGDDLNGETLGIIGMGSIGKKVAMRANSFGLTVLYHNRNRLDKDLEKKLSANYLDLPSLLSQSKYIVLLTPLNKETKHLINRNTFAMMRKDAYIINMARGKIIKEADLVLALENNRIAGAGLDVFEFEPKVNKKLMNMGNVVMMPHAGSATYKARMGMMDLACRNIINYLIYNKYDNLVNREVL
jgi:lactate dehydrogenase-like 2-hydroxyacid dehydrogenase